MKRIFVPTRSGSDWQRLLAKPGLHWKKGQSAMSAAASWEAAADRLPAEISSLLDESRIPELKELELLAAIPEWEVPMPGGTTSSFTDVMAITRNDLGLCVIAVEAKVDEAFGEKLKTKREGASPGQLERLSYLQELLRVQRFADDVRYQLLHRTASAILTAEQFHADSAVMVVQAFSQVPELKADFDLFCKAMGASDATSSLYCVEGFVQPSLFLGWCNGDRRFTEAEIPPAPEFAKNDS